MPAFFTAPASLLPADLPAIIRHIEQMALDLVALSPTAAVRMALLADLLRRGGAA
jgi:hypothetical protein